MQEQTFQVVHSGDRLLSYLKKELGDCCTTRHTKWLIEHHRCTLNGFIERFCSTRLKKGDQIRILLEAPVKESVEASRILFEDASCLLYDKPASMTSEQLTSLLGYFPVHRLDRDTSGVIVFAKTVEIQAKLEALFVAQGIKKRYLAWVSPPPALSKGKICMPLTKRVLHDGASIAVPHARGKEAVTEWKLVKRHGPRALIQAFPKTGRMHQIRAHLKAIGSPIVGDAIYGGRLQECRRPLLHAELLSFELEGKHYQAIAPLPDDFS